MLRPRLLGLVSIFAVAIPALISGCGDDSTLPSSTGTTDADTTDGTTAGDDGSTSSTGDLTTSSTSTGEVTTSSTSTPGTTDDSSTGEPPVNNDPIAKNDGKYIAKSGFPMWVSSFEGLLVNDADPDNDDLTVIAVDPISAGGATITFEEDGSFNYQAPNNFWGTDTFGYTITDGNNGFDTATVTVAVNPVQIDTNDVADGFGGFAINGTLPQDHVGESIRSAGDVNGDGYDDIIVGAPVADAGDVPNSGATYVVFGEENADTLFLANIEESERGFKILGAALNDESGRSVSGVGDINGDGYGDLVLGAPNADPNGTNSGRAFVILGKSDNAPVDLQQVAMGVGGFMIEGQADINFAGYAASGAGDVNGDGLEDIVVGAFGFDVGDESFAGRAYVIFGKQNTDPLSLSHIAAGLGGFAISGVSSGDFTGSAVRGAGDVNGDGFADLVVGAHGSSTSGTLTGRAYVVFGKPDNVNVDLNDVVAGVGGFMLEGEFEGDRAAFSVSGAGDVNGDGLDDVLIGAPRADPAGDASGRTYLIFGREETSPILLNDVVINSGAPNNPGFVINGSFIRDYSGVSVDAAGDVNGDGLDDMIIGAYGADPNGSQSGRAFVLYGKQDTDAVSLATLTLGDDGFVINGETLADYAGYAVSGGGDHNGDGYADLLVCSHGSDAPGVDAGRCYVVYGGDYSNVVDAEGTSSPELINGTADANIFVGGAGDDLIHSNGGADIIYAGTGRDTITVLDDSFYRIDGGGRRDTLELLGGFTLDLTAMPDRRLTGIEVIDIGEEGSTLILDMRSLRALTDETTVVRIEGDASCTLQADLSGGTWIEEGLVDEYMQYTNGYLTLRVWPDVDAQVTL
ncbi:MAG: FG-GAP repeat protein [Myxococcales bacterium]|nr:FG-GAP repeat protein [Myxococcales bacterium]